MAGLFSGTLNIPAGTKETNIFPVSGGATSATASLDGTVFPVGITTIDVFFSFDGGTTFPNSATLTCDGPLTVLPNGRGGNYTISYTVSQPPTNVKFRTTAPSAFSTHADLLVG